MSASSFAVVDRQAPEITVSVVSHGQGALVLPLLRDLGRHCASGIRVVLTLNIPEDLAVDPGACPFPLDIVRNDAPKGFSANHNAALKGARSPFLCVLNPDIRIAANPFPRLLEDLRKPSVAAVAPRMLNPEGGIEDNARRFPTIPFLLRKLFGLVPNLDYPASDAPFSPDWIAGMFMLFRAEIFREVSGFDERYFLYYEDVDVCRRLRARGYDIRLVPSVTAIHDARRESRRSLRHLRWHLASIVRFFLVR